jgi:hypothetical protein
VRGKLFSPRGLALLGACGVCLVGCVLLAWWQWDRYESSSGTLQNLGYVLQWPLFGLFPFYMFWRMRRLAAEAPAAAESAGEDVAHVAAGRTGEAPARAAEPVVAESAVAEAIPAPASRRRGGPPPWQRPRPRTPPPGDEPDEELAAYNRYLAELNARDADRAS